MPYLGTGGHREMYKMKRLVAVFSVAFLIILLFWSCSEKEQDIAVASVTLSQSTAEMIAGESISLKATISPSNATDREVIWLSSNQSVASVDQSGRVVAIAEGTSIITAKAKSKYATCKVVVKIAIEAVDLGLSVKWANENLGATAPEKYGDYYAWGETEPKEAYSWSTYKWCNGSSTTLTKYNTSTSYGTVDNKTILDAEDDVAQVKLGGKWRIPTSRELEELISSRNNSSYQWEWKSINGHNGWLVTYLVNNNSIFIPAAGFRYDTNFGNVGSNGCFCSSYLNTSFPNNAWHMGFASDNVNRYGNYRCYGFSVRPVSD